MMIYIRGGSTAFNSVELFWRSLRITRMRALRAQTRYSTEQLTNVQRGRMSCRSPLDYWSRTQQYYHPMGYMNRRCIEYERIMTDMMYHAEPFVSVRIMLVVGYTKRRQVVARLG
jgi:hypothetical protein